MRVDFIRYLVCPCCEGTLKCIPYRFLDATEIAEGLLICGCGEAFIIHRGVPRMLTIPKVPASFIGVYGERVCVDAPKLARKQVTNDEDFSFSFQWSNHPYNDLTWELTVSERIEIFCHYAGLRQDQLCGIRLLDAGCGNGTLSAALAHEGVMVTAMDYSESVYKGYHLHVADSVTKNESKDRLFYLQGDVRQPPFSRGQFDIVYADGVLHHTPNTKESFFALAKMVRPGGQFILWLYRSDSKIGHRAKMALVKVVRRCTERLSNRSRMRLCYIGAFAILTAVRVAHLLGYRRRRIIPLRHKAVNLFDTISPEFNHEHTSAEVTGWFKEAGFNRAEDVSLEEHRLNAGGFAVRGIR